MRYDYHNAIILRDILNYHPTLMHVHVHVQVHVYMYIVFFLHSIINLKLASAYPNRIAESFLSFASEINRISLSEFLRSVSSEDDRLLKKIRRQTVPSDKFYNYICEKVRVIHPLYSTINYHTSLVAHIQWCGNSEPTARHFYLFSSLLSCSLYTFVYSSYSIYRTFT